MSVAGCLVGGSDRGAVPISAIVKDGFARWLEQQDASLRRWVRASGFEARPGQVQLVAGRDGGLERVLLGVDPADGPWAFGDLPAKLPHGRYKLDSGPVPATDAALGWALGSYAFRRYKRAKVERPALLWPAKANRRRVEAVAGAIWLARDLINTPANDLGPMDLAMAARAVARRHRAAITVISGAALARGYPLVHAVGRGSVRKPCLVDLRWGRRSAPRITLVGKGVCFDSGGLDIKPSSAMLLMKKDMGGAALMLGLASAIMDLRVPVRLRLLIPAVENSVSGDAFRPLDVIPSRKGMTVEIGNTDAEGRLILADPLFEASKERPDLLIDAATLTGAARVALGPDVPALFSNDDNAAEHLMACGEAERDPLWRLPLWRPYRRLLDSKVADINNVSDGPFAGAITAALFLQEFVGKDRPWIHLDTMAWNPSAKPGRPAGGEANAMRALLRMIEEHVTGVRRPRR